MYIIIIVSLFIDLKSSNRTTGDRAFQIVLSIEFPCYFSVASAQSFITTHVGTLQLQSALLAVILWHLLMICYCIIQIL